MSCTSVRWRLFAPTILPALKSCMRCSPCAATVPDMPEPIMLMRMLPGASAAKHRLHQVRERADGSPVRLAEHARADQHQRDRKDQRDDGQPDGELERIVLHDAEHRGEQDHADGDERERELLAAGADLARLERRERSSDELPLED